MSEMAAGMRRGLAAAAPGQIDALTSLRGLAAMLVVLFHFQAGPLQYALRQYTPILDRGYLAVDLFFVLSGFVIAHVYGRTFADGWKGRDVARFMWARFTRVYPLHIATLLAIVGIYLVGQTLAYGTVAMPWEGRWSWLGMIHNAILTQGPWLDYPSWNSPAWSISAEWHVYLLFPFAFPLLRRIPSGWLLPTFAVLVAIRYIGDQFGTDLRHGPESAFRFVPAFLAGILLHRLYSLGWLSSALAGTWPLLLVTGCILAMMHYRASDAVFLPVISLLVMATVYCSGAAASVLEFGPLLYLGEISYSIYLTHPLIDRVIFYAFETLGMRQGDLSSPAYLAFLTGSVMLVIGVSAATYRWIEMPSRTYLRRIYPARVLRPVAAAQG